MFSEKWQKRYLDLARFKASWSQDTTKVGAVIVHPDNYEISSGYNDLPRGVKATDSRQIAPEKYLFVCHAESNALMTALFSGVSVKGCSMFVTLFPCCECAKLIIQSGISTVYYEKPLNYGVWEDSNSASKAMLLEAGIDCVVLDGQVF